MMHTGLCVENIDLSSLSTFINIVETNQLSHATLTERDKPFNERAYLPQQVLRFRD